MRKLVRFIIAILISLPLFLFYLPFFYFMEWVFDEDGASDCGELYRGWKQWFLMK